MKDSPVIIGVSDPLSLDDMLLYLTPRYDDNSKIKRVMCWDRSAGICSLEMRHAAAAHVATAPMTEMVAPFMMAGIFT